MNSLALVLIVAVRIGTVARFPLSLEAVMFNQARRLIAILVACSVSIGAMLSPSQFFAAEIEQGAVTLEWLGHNGWRVTSPGGKVILLNPFVNNADSIMSELDITQADLILVTNGHGDEVGQTVDIARNTGASVLGGSFSLGTWFTEVGVPPEQVVRINPGERFRMDGITVRIVHGMHGSDISARPGYTPNTASGGIAAAYFITFENGYTLYFGGSGAATLDQGMWARLYQPDAAILYMGGNKEPLDYALQVSLLQTDNPNLRTLFPGHHRAVQTAPRRPWRRFRPQSTGCSSGCE
jgi:L-ascorbate metabolism protein UlaG (beta-lactamase superfamily)